jgi:hypothetical protein
MTTDDKKTSVREQLDAGRNLLTPESQIMEPLDLYPDDSKLPFGRTLRNSIVLGVDFTSAPRKSKPITVAWAILDGTLLDIMSIVPLTALDVFEGELKTGLLRFGTIIGLDFPFSQPTRFLNAMRWGRDWPSIISTIDAMSMDEFLTRLKAYRDAQPRGEKHHLRRCDALAGAVSPMMVYGVPVGRMWFRGAPILLRSGVSVLPCAPTDSERVALEVYPALLAQYLLGEKRSYKVDDARKADAEQRAAREDMLDVLQKRKNYGLRVQLVPGIAERAIEDHTGDVLDAILACVQAAWASTLPDFGIPPDVDALEGWICDPSLLR